MHDQSERIDRFGLPEGLIAALLGASLLVGAFTGFTAALPLAPTERWAALTTFAILALFITLPGCSAIADAVGRTVRRDWRAFVTVLAAIPVLFSAYALAVRAFAIGDLLSAIALVALPAAALWRSRAARRLTVLDGVGLAYLWLVSAFALWPLLTLPVIGGRVDFFTMALVPLVVLLLAARGWPGLGYTWHLSGADLRASVLGALIGLALVAPGADPATFAAGGVAPIIGRAIEAYFFVALPITLLDRGVVQQGVMRSLAAWPRLAPVLGIAVGAMCSGIRVLSSQPGNWTAMVLAALAAVGYGWVYWRTGKVTAAAASQMLVVWAG